MVRSQVAARALGVSAAASVIAIVSMTVSAAPGGQAAAAVSGPLEALWQGAASTAPGTYNIGGPAIEPATTPLHVLLQADVLRGPNRTIRVPVVVGAELPQAAEIRLRVVTAAAGQPARVVGNAAGSSAVGPLRFVQDFALPPGDYEIQAVIGQSLGSRAATAALAKMRLTVPDIWNGTLAVTPIVLGQDAGAARRGQGQPFNFGPTALIPALDARFPQSGAIRVAFRVFNWSAGTEAKPDLTAEYLFYERGTRGLHFFNKIKPQRLTAATLGTNFDPADGAVAAGMVVPLGAFTFGDFQLKVSATDNRNKQTAVRLVDFAVSP